MALGELSRNLKTAYSAMARDTLALDSTTVTAVYAGSLLVDTVSHFYSLVRSVRSRVRVYWVSGGAQESHALRRTAMEKLRNREIRVWHGATETGP